MLIHDRTSLIAYAWSLGGGGGYMEASQPS